MALNFTNNATSTLASSINASQTTITVQSAGAALFPTLSANDWCPITVVDGAGNMEIMKCTGRSTSTLTVVRAQEGTTGKSFSAGARVDVRLTAAALAALDFASQATKSTPVDGDSVSLIDSADSDKPKRVLWSAIKSTLKSYFDTLYQVAGSYVTPSRTFTAGTGLTGGGDLSADRSFAVSYGTAAGTAAQGNDSRFAAAVQKSGDTMTGLLTLSGDPTTGLHAASKQYVDGRAAGKYTMYKSSDTWVKSPGLVGVAVKVRGASGAGGARAGSTSGGNGAGASIGWKYISAASLGTSESVTIGAAGVGASNANGTAGGTSSFGSFLSVTGGTGGKSGSNGSADGDIGTVSGADIMMVGGTPFGAGNNTTGQPTPSFNTVPAPALAGSGNGGYGARGNAAGTTAGGGGDSGIVEIWEFYS